MVIYSHKEEGLFHLQSKEMSYVLSINEGYPVHLYWGARLHDNQNLIDIVQDDEKYGLDRLPQEYPQYGTGDFRHPAYLVQLEDGTRVTEALYKGHRIFKGKSPLVGLPSVYTEKESEAETLEIELYDSYASLTIYLSYTIFHDRSVICRNTRFKNNGTESLRLWSALSASIDFPEGDSFESLYLSGAWAREGNIERRALSSGSTIIESRRGMSSHQLNPFMALVKPETNENRGEAYGFSLVYSGGFKIEAEVNSFQSVRLSLGINPFDFKWVLEVGSEFQTPESVMVFSQSGIGQMSRTYHSLYRERLCRGNFRDKERPILVNNWEATYFNFDEDKLHAIAEEGKEAGIELFVLDDGWFGKRDDDTTSLGDWSVDHRKLPNGLKHLGESINKKGMEFGLWVEPEMISPESNLYRENPDWCIHVEGRRRSEHRSQLVLDLTREDVREYLYSTLKDLFQSAPIRYVKWDMNRSLTEIGSANLSSENQAETAHRYVLGLYSLLERITSEFPDILFESCSSGGGRFDPGMLHYMPQTWTSDNTDAIERLKIQYGISLVYPISSIGAHVSTVPNHQVHRLTPLDIRGDVAMSGTFGYELDLTKLTNEEKQSVKEQVAAYKEIRPLIQYGDFYRLKSPFNENETSWMFVSKDQKEAIVFFFRVLAEPVPIRKRIKLNGLNRNWQYFIKEQNRSDYGDRLEQIGLDIPVMKGDFVSVIYSLKAKT